MIINIYYEALYAHSALAAHLLHQTPPMSKRWHSGRAFLASSTTRSTGGSLMSSTFETRKREFRGRIEAGYLFAMTIGLVAMTAIPPVVVLALLGA
jgi:hypothetical protein